MSTHEVAAPADAMRRLYPVPDSARQLGIGRTSVFGLIKAGKLRTVRIGRRTLIPASELDRYVAELESEMGR